MVFWLIIQVKYNKIHKLKIFHLKIKIKIFYQNKQNVKFLKPVILTAKLIEPSNHNYYYIII